jgi:hypothetical protein
MGTPDGELPPDGVIRWLRSPEGEEWSGNLPGIGVEHAHGGAFGEVVFTEKLWVKAASWPDPIPGNGLE